MTTPHENFKGSALILIVQALEINRLLYKDKGDLVGYAIIDKVHTLFSYEFPLDKSHERNFRYRTFRNNRIQNIHHIIDADINEIDEMMKVMKPLGETAALLRRKRIILSNIRACLYDVFFVIPSNAKRKELVKKYLFHIEKEDINERRSEQDSVAHR